MKNARIISVQAIKGGVGKTTISTNLAYICALAGYKVLMCDQDPQGSATELFNVYDENDNKLDKGEIKNLSLYDLYLRDVDTHKYIFKTRYENIDIIPNARNVRDDTPFDIVFEHESRGNEGLFLAFRYNLLKIKGDYDFVFIDGYPTDGCLTNSIVIASDFVLTPALADIYNVNAVEDMAYKIAYLDQKFGRNTRFLGYFFNQVILWKDHDRFVESYSKKFFNAGIDQVEVDVRYSKPVTQKAASCRKLIVEYNKNSNVAKDIIKLAVDGIGIISDEKLKILEDNIENKRFGLRPVLENNPISTDQELEEE